MFVNQYKGDITVQCHVGNGNIGFHGCIFISVPFRHVMASGNQSTGTLPRPSTAMIALIYF